MNKNIILGKFIKEKREILGLTIRELKEKAGLSTTSIISDLENASKKRIDPLILKKIAAALDLSYLDLYKIIGFIDEEDINTVLEKSGLDVIEESKMIKMPVFSGVSAGGGVLCYGDVLFYDYFPPMKNMENKFNIQVVGDSMEPMIPNGAVLTINEQSNLENGEIGVFIIDDKEGFVKKFYREDKFIRLVSLNPNYNDIIILPNEHFKIVGKVIKVSYTL